MNKPLISVSNIICCAGLKGTVVDALCKAILAYRFVRTHVRSFSSVTFDVCRCSLPLGLLTPPTSFEFIVVVSWLNIVLVLWFILVSFCALLFTIVGLFGFHIRLTWHKQSA